MYCFLPYLSMPHPVLSVFISSVHSENESVITRAFHGPIKAHIVLAYSVKMLSTNHIVIAGLNVQDYHFLQYFALRHIVVDQKQMVKGGYSVHEYASAHKSICKPMIGRLTSRPTFCRP